MSDDRATSAATARPTFLEKHGDRLLVIGLYAYVVILAIGVVAEAFDIQSILRLYP